MIDFHTHIMDCSYCCDKDLTLDVYKDVLLKSDDLTRVYATSHGFAAYFPEDVAWKWEYMSNPKMFDDYKSWGNDRIEKLLAKIDNYRDYGIYSAFEVEMLSDGRLTVSDEMRNRFDLLIGSIHYLAPNAGWSFEKRIAQWQDHFMELTNQDFDVYAHPLRWLYLFPENNLTMVERYTEIILSRLKERNIAVEINSHHDPKKEYEAVLLKKAVEEGLTITFATDSHACKQVYQGFKNQYQLLEVVNITLEDINFLTLNPN